MNELYSLYTRAFPSYPESPESYGCITDENANILTSSDSDGNLLGFAVVRGNTVSLLCVDEAHRRQGIGSDLLGLAEEHIRNAGGDTVTLGLGFGYIFQGVPEDHKEAVEFFAHRGYTSDWTSVNMRLNLCTFAGSDNAYLQVVVYIQWEGKAVGCCW